MDGRGAGWKVRGGEIEGEGNGGGGVLKGRGMDGRGWKGREIE